MASLSASAQRARVESESVLVHARIHTCSDMQGGHPSQGVHARQRSPHCVWFTFDFVGCRRWRRRRPHRLRRLRPRVSYVQLEAKRAERSRETTITRLSQSFRLRGEIVFVSASDRRTIVAERAEDVLIGAATMRSYAV